MRILVTGGAGFIGSHVIDALAAAGHEVAAVDCLHPAAHGPSASRPAVPMTAADVTVADVRDREAVEATLRGVEAVFHHAAMVGMGVDYNDMPEYVSCNDLGTAVLLAAMARAGVHRLVLASSMVVYGEGAYTCPRHGGVRSAPRVAADLATGQFEPRCPGCGEKLSPAPITEEAPLEPRSVYAATKLAQEHLASVWARECGAQVAALRYHNVYGPGMPRDTPYSGVAAIFRSSLDRGEPARVFEDGGQRRDFIHVRDVARANLAALAVLAAPTGGVGDWGHSWSGLRAYNIASGSAHTLAEMASALTRAMGGPQPVVTGEFRVGDVRHVTASPERARRELGFSATVDFHAGMTSFASAPLRDSPRLDAPAGGVRGC